VEQHHQRDGDGSQALDVGTEAPVLGRRPRLVTRRLEALDGRRPVLDQQVEPATRPSTRALLWRIAAGRRFIAGGKATGDSAFVAQMSDDSSKRMNAIESASFPGLGFGSPQYGGARPAPMSVNVNRATTVGL
jgi:hypothetical protein